MMTDERCMMANSCAKLSISSVSIEIDVTGLLLRSGTIGSQNEPKEGEGGWGCKTIIHNTNIVHKHT